MSASPVATGITPEVVSADNLSATPSQLDEEERPTVRVFQKNITMKMRYQNRNGQDRYRNVEASYTGPFVNGVPHGSGMLRFPNGSMYLGDFENGLIQGKGTFNLRTRHGKKNRTISGEFNGKELR